MLRLLSIALCAAALACCTAVSESQAQDRGFGRTWGGQYAMRDMERFYHYPYVYYPQNFWASEYYRSANSLYYRYPQEMRVPVYNTGWHNYFPQTRRYHFGHHFLLDVF